MRNIVLTLLAACLLFGCAETPTPKEAPTSDTGQPIETVAKDSSKVVVHKDSSKLVTKQKEVTTKEKEVTTEETPASTDFSRDYLMGKFSPKKHADFTVIKSAHASRSNMYMRKDAYSAFVKMYQAAKKDGIRLKIISATRPFHAQRGIWEAKWSGSRKVEGQDLSKTTPASKDRALKILRFSSMPGTSRHHWGTDIDLNNLNNSWFEKGEGKRIYEWLSANAAAYGYCQPYSPKGAARPNGYEEEKWHWSYLPVAKTLLRRYQEEFSNETIEGFKGAESAVEISVVENYVVGISGECK